MMITTPIKKRKQGFTLIEVALAVLAVGLGLVTVFGLFPAGLQNASDDAADSRAGLFAGVVFSEMRGMASGVTDTNSWNTLFSTDIPVAGLTLKVSNLPDKIKFPVSTPGNDPESYLQYTLSVTNAPFVGPHRIISATLVTCDGQYGLFTTQNVFYTEFYYMGM
jgi:prepilin-type N-terminal cleavage/methylation domain-containing protein